MSPKERSPFAKRLAELRRRAKLTQEAAGAIVGVEPSAWSHWEAGRREPRVSDLAAIADALGVEVAELLRPPADTATP